MNYMKQVAEMLGVELGEVFGIKAHSALHRYRITESGVEYYDVTGRWCSVSPDLLNKILTGQCEIKKMPWKPAMGQEYYMPSIDDGRTDYCGYTWSDSRNDDKRHKNGLVCRTVDEAIELAEHMLEVARGRYDDKE